MVRAAWGGGGGAGECGAQGRALPPLPPPPPERASEPPASGSAEIFLPPSLSAAAPPSPAATTQRPGLLLGHSAPARRGGRRDLVPRAGKARGPQPYMPSPALLSLLALTTSGGGSSDHWHPRDGDTEVPHPEHFLLLPFSDRKASPFFGWASSSVPPLPMTFKAPHDLASIYLVHLPTLCKAPLACSQFP